MKIGDISVDNKVVEHISKQGHYYTTTENANCGPFSIHEVEQPNFYKTIARKLSVEPKEVLKAHLKNLQKPIQIDEIQDILSLTIKHDDSTKILLFLAMLLTYTEQEQQNVAMQAESSSGKSYIPLEVASYFQREEYDKDILFIASASPTAFFHEAGMLVDEHGKPINFGERPLKNASSKKKMEWDRRLENSRILVDLERKILIFLDQPHYMLMEKLRPLLSHDKKELNYKITDRSARKGLRTKNVTLIGFPTIIFCSAKLSLDEQERTRVFLLSPEVEEEKIIKSIYLLGEKLGNRDKFKNFLESDARRYWLKARVASIHSAGIRDIVIEDWQDICKQFLEDHPNPIPRHQRDFPRLISLIKAHALLNYAHRELGEDRRIKANSEDIEAGFKLYDQVAKPNEIGLSPHVYEIYQKVIKPHLKLDTGLDRRFIQQEYFRVYHRALKDEKLRREILPSLESAGLIVQDRDPQDKRRMLIYTTDQSPISIRNASTENEERNRGNIRGVYKEVIERFRKSFPEKFRDGEFEDYIRSLEAITQEEAHKLFNNIVSEGKIGIDLDGFWRWIN
jgi:hypothetical protein